MGQPGMPINKILFFVFDSPFLFHTMWFQGFCCHCGSLNKGGNERGGFRCGLMGFFGGSGSAHCMRLNQLW